MSRNRSESWLSSSMTNDEQVLRSVMWNATDKLYKKAVERYGKVLTNRAVKVKEEDSSADFS
ncbi:MAG: hypothetical protein ACKO2H_09865, partial [Bacteroidota bacterium]